MPATEARHAFGLSVGSGAASAVAVLGGTKPGVAVKAGGVGEAGVLVAAGGSQV